MTEELQVTSRERMLGAISCQPTDYVPCCFMIFSGLREQSRDDLDYVRRQLDLGLDSVAELTMFGTGSGSDNPDLPGPPLHFHPETVVSDWLEDTEEGGIIHRRYDTPAGPLTAAVRWTEDWRAGVRVPLFDDWIIPRSQKFLVETDEDIDKLPYVLAPVNQEARAMLRQMAAPELALARERNLLTGAGWGVGLEAAAWLCGHEGMLWTAIDRPERLDRLVQVLHEWNMSRMEALLELRPDLFIRRGWYEGTDFLSPDHFQRFVLPSLQREAQFAHEAGAKFAYINTSGTMPILEMLMQAGVDVLVGVDPVQGKGTDMRELRRLACGRMALWGGVNGFVTVERGSPDEVRQAVAAAMETLGPEGFILSPVDNVVDSSEVTWRNVEALLEAWQERR
jgi:uroporphyrinogen-III decarboxylase